MKLHKKFRIRRSVAFGLVLALGGCASDIKYDRPAAGTDASQQIEALKSRTQKDKQDQVDAFAPISFAKGMKSLDDAVAARAKNDSSEDILDHTAKASAYLTRAEDHSKRLQGTLGEVASARSHAMENGAPRYPTALPYFSKAESQLSDFAIDADKNDGMGDEPDKVRVELLSNYQESELLAIQEKNLGTSHARIETAKKEGASEWAPKSLADAENKYAEAVGTIKRDRTNQQAIQTSSREAQAKADFLLQVTREAKASKTRRPEDIAAAKLGSQSTIADLKHENAEMMEKGRLGETVKTLQSKFSKSEAQVYEDGEKVHIRLMGLKFPSGSATIQTSAYPLLGKVKEVLAEVQPSEVRIDGRTDARGGKKMNQALSKKRAESVKEFLAASAAVDPAKVTTEGFDYQKPVAAEKTSDGRSVNRGIDVVLVPGTASDKQQSGTVAPSAAPAPDAKSG